MMSSSWSVNPGLVPELGRTVEASPADRPRIRVVSAPNNFDAVVLSSSGGQLREPRGHARGGDRLQVIPECVCCTWVGKNCYHIEDPAPISGQPYGHGWREPLVVGVEDCGSCPVWYRSLRVKSVDSRCRDKNPYEIGRA